MKAERHVIKLHCFRFARRSPSNKPSLSYQTYLSEKLFDAIPQNTTITSPRQVQTLPISLQGTHELDYHIQPKALDF